MAAVARTIYRVSSLVVILIVLCGVHPAEAQQDITGQQRDCWDGATAAGNCAAPLPLASGEAGVTAGAGPSLLLNGGEHLAATMSQPIGAGPSGNEVLHQRPAAPPTEFQLMVQGSVGSILPVFGADLFSNVPSTFAPNDLSPVGSDYIVGPGDQLLLRVWGGVTFNRTVSVDRAGDIYLPQAGAVHVAGIRFSQLDGYLRAQLAPVFRNFDLSVNMGRLRSIQIFVVGQAERPGTYSISALSTLMDALFVTGGPSPHGSMRRIEVLRRDKVVDTFDLYDLLLGGHQASNIALMSGDIIDIPPVGPVVAVAGSVNKPAVYELRGTEMLADVIRLAGGPSAMAALGALRIERTSPSGDRYTVMVPQDARSMQMPMRAADIVQVPSIALNFEKTVTLRGNVANPGRYAWHPGMHVSDLIPERGALETRGYWQQRIAMGLPSPAYTPLADAQARPKTAAELIQTMPAIDWKYAVIERTDTQTLATSLVSFNLGEALGKSDMTQDVALQPGDVLTIFSTAEIDVPQMQRIKYVHLSGEFVKAGVYSALPGETLRGLVRRAGGLTPQAYLYASQFLRVSTQQQQQQRYDQYLDEVQREMEASTANNASIALSPNAEAASQTERRQAEDMIATMRRIRPAGRVVLDFTPQSAGIDAIPDLPLEDGDQFVIPAMPHTVNVFGAVYSQNAYQFLTGRDVGSYLRQAGGATRAADASREFVIRASGSIVSRQYARSTLFSDGLNGRAIYPGDSVVMPNAMNRRGVLRGLMDWSAVFSQFGLGVGAFSLLGF